MMGKSIALIPIIESFNNRGAGSGECFMAAGGSYKQQCPSCEGMVLIKDPKLVGKKIDCPQCKYRFVVEKPAAGAEAEAPAEEPKARPKATTNAAGKKPGAAPATAAKKKVGPR